MHKQPELCRKKSAFRQKLRREYIQNMFKQRRQQFLKLQANNNKHQYIDPEAIASELNNSQHIKQLGEYRLGKSDSGKKNKQRFSYPYQSDSIPAIGGEGIGEENDSQAMKQVGLRVRKFQNYQEFEDYMDRLFGMLPGSVFNLVNLLSNNPRLTPQLTNYLFSDNKRSLLHLVHKLTQSSVSQFINYIYILQSILIRLQEGEQRRGTLIKVTSQQITARTLSLINSNKIIRMDILKAYFDYIITLGDDVKLLTSLEIVMLADHVKEVFGKYFNQDQQYNHYDVFDSVVLICNNIVSLDSHNPHPSPITQADTYYQTEMLKQTFISQLLRNPKCLLNMILVAISPQTDSQLQHILRFFINLTYVINKAQSLYLFIDSLTVLINAVLSQWKILKKLPIINILALRLINNIAVNDIYSAEVLWRQRIITRSVQIFGQWIIVQAEKLQKQVNQNEKEVECPQMHVYSQFLSTISTYIILLGNSGSDQHYQLNFIDNLKELTQMKKIHVVLLQSLTLPHLTQNQTQSQLLSKILQALLILSNYQANNMSSSPRYNNPKDSHTSGVLQSMFKYQSLFDNLIHRLPTANNVTALCQALQSALQTERERLENLQRMEVESCRDQDFYRSYVSEFKQGNSKQMVGKGQAEQIEHKREHI